MSMTLPLFKRHMSDDFWSSENYYGNQNLAFSDDCLEVAPGVIPNIVFLPQGDPVQSQSISTDASEETSSLAIRRKRAYDEFEQEQSHDETANEGFSVQIPDEINDVEWLQYIRQTQPSRKVLEAVSTVSNPFQEVAHLRHRKLRDPISVKGVNSYVKFGKLRIPGTSGVRSDDVPLSNTQPCFDTRPRSQYSGSNQICTENRNMPSSSRLEGSSQSHASLRGVPAAFGRSFGLDTTDAKLFRFFQHAICSGRTLLHRTNGWLKDLAPMAEAEEMMHHAVLALAAGYVLDLMPTPNLLKCANEHYRKANELLTMKLRCNSFLEPGQEDPIVGCIRVLWCDDIVQWELRRDNLQIPRWWQAVKEGIKIMAKTDRNFRYYTHSTNIQCTSARISNANNMAMVHLVAGMTLPLTVQDTADEHLHPWLLEGTDKESRRIHGGTGLCPKLLHMFGQITHLCASMHENDTSIILPLGANALAQKLINFHQWSELSQGPPSTELLLQSCILKNGLVDTPQEVTELSGEAWVQTARIYLQIRFFRLPRNHPYVQEPFKLLCRIIERLPCSGTLFTAQTPFFPVFLLGLIATTPDERQIARKWFGTVVSNVGARSNVPPIWQALQETWNWMDQELIDDEISDVEQRPIRCRLAWWELLAARWWDRYGILSIV